MTGQVVTKEEALAFLDAIGEEFRGADAEFDDYATFEHDVPLEEQPLVRLLAIAFGPWAADDAIEHWYEKIYVPFSDRYDFC